VPSRVDRFKANIHFLVLPYRDLYGALDACKAADYVIFVLSTVVEVDTWGDTALRCLQAQGLPDVTTVAIVSVCFNSRRKDLFDRERSLRIIKRALNSARTYLNPSCLLFAISCPRRSGFTICRWRRRQSMRREPYAKACLQESNGEKVALGYSANLLLGSITRYLSRAPRRYFVLRSLKFVSA